MTSASTAVKPPRYMFLDVLRGLAVVWMIQVHVTNRLLDPSLRNGDFFNLLNISNGFVAPTFIFCAGAGLWIALSRKSDEYRRATPTLFLYLRRLSYILFWAYFLHVPVFSLAGMLHSSYDTLITGFQFDVLHTIVFSSLVLLLIHRLAGSVQRSVMVSWIVATATAFGTKFFFDSHIVTSFPILVQAPLNPSISPFSFLPWCCYFFAGFSFTSMFFASDDKNRLARMLAVGSIVAIAIIFTLKNLFTTPYSDTWWVTSPGMHAFRICTTVFGLCCLYLLERKLQQSSIARIVQRMGNESLFLYVSHLLLVYGTAATVFLSAINSTSTGYSMVIVIWLALLTVLVPCAFIWASIKKTHPVLARWVLIIQIAWMFGSFIIVPEHFNMFG